MPSILQIILTFLACALGGVLLARFFKLPSILGYLLVGLAIGPHALGFAPDSETVKDIAEFGVVFLMFSIGLEFNLTKLMAMRHIVFGFGVSQVFLTMLLAIPAGYFMRFVLPIVLPWHVLFALGGALAMSSTAIVVKALAEKGELDTQHGKNVLGVLLFQDLVVILLLILIPSLGKNPGDIVFALSIAGIKIAVALVLIFFVGQKIFSSWFRIVASLRSQELFMLNVFLIAIGMSAITYYFGLSMALGAFMAGMLISETPYRYQVEEGIASFRDILLGLFFITVGMMVDINAVIKELHLVLFLFFAALIFKFIIIAGLARRFGSSSGVAIRTGICLAQAGEFGFVLINQIDQLDWIDPSLSQAVLAAMLLSMLVAPILIQYSNSIALRFSKNEWFSQSVDLTKIVAQSIQNDQHVIICGFGASGQHVATMLENEGISYLALDSDPARVHQASEAGKSVVYGASHNSNNLIAAGIVRAKAIVITFRSVQESIKVIQQIEELNPGIPILVRARDDTEMNKLILAGATQVIPEKAEGSVMLAAQVLSLAGVPLRRVMRQVSQAREDRYGKLRGYFPSTEEEGADDVDAIRLSTVHLKSQMNGVNKSLEWVENFGVVVQNVRRKLNGQKAYTKLEPSPELLLESEDILVLSGNVETLHKAEKLITKAIKVKAKIKVKV
ncbi:potassium efflux system protein [Polynucleobacter sp. SHI8]|uniref:cation:proton antiporter n=1 Tax=unclassified Polynucleobacter TaxID=2640945 RepID=UPI002491F78A|nr:MULTISPECIES: cation:proton antiporter [unclassified Polynucleobacter]BDW12116.1 potassium efflux system protein [Polynucleobacter sp. SHI2]BDW14564.1 potassium efflux system protein [Polynucleobacter sp. SHI8]